MSLINIIKLSAKLPNKQALFALNRVPMRDTLVYLFCLFFVLFLPYTITNMIEVYQNAISKSQLVLQVILFYPFFMMFLVIISISFLAVFALILRYLLGRKLAYQQLWKMTAYAILWPFVLYQVILFLPISLDSHEQPNFLTGEYGQIIETHHLQELQRILTSITVY